MPLSDDFFAPSPRRFTDRRHGRTIRERGSKMLPKNEKEIEESRKSVLKNRTMNPKSPTVCIHCGCRYEEQHMDHCSVLSPEQYKTDRMPKRIDDNHDPREYNRDYIQTNKGSCDQCGSRKLCFLPTPWAVWQCQNCAHEMKCPNLDENER